MTTLRGAAWNHSRGYTPLVAVGQRFEELHPGVEIVWEKRSLREFGETPVEELAGRYDLLVIDHPFCGAAAAARILLPLDDQIPPELQEELRAQSVGKSYSSYEIDGRLWALPIDAACPVAAYRPDLLGRAERDLPQTWEEVLDLAGTGQVIAPFIDTDSILHFFMLCRAFGGSPCGSAEEVVASATGIQALEALRELARRIPSCCFEMNPIRIHETLGATDEYSYCPFVFGYSNYSRDHFSLHRVAAVPAVRFNGNPLQSPLGGAGLAVSARTQHVGTAVSFAAFAMSGAVQRTIYTFSGGQPGHRAAWHDPMANRLTNGYFQSTLPALDRAFLRPRYPGYVPFQEAGGHIVREFLSGHSPPAEALDRLNQVYLRSRPPTGNA